MALNILIYRENCIKRGRKIKVLNAADCWKMQFSSNLQHSKLLNFTTQWRIIILNPVYYFWFAQFTSSKENKTLFCLHFISCFVAFPDIFLAPNSKQAYETFIQYILKELFNRCYSDKSHVNLFCSINLFTNLLINLFSET